MKIFKWISNKISELIDFLLCFLRKDCNYSRNYLLGFMTFFLITYLAIYTEKEYGELLIFLAALLGINSYNKGMYYKNKKDEATSSNTSSKDNNGEGLG